MNTAICPDLAQLVERIRAQNGERPDVLDGSNWSKILWYDTRFGAPVRIVCEGAPDLFGYLMTVPPYGDVDMEGVIHCPETPGEKCSSGPLWMTLLDATAAEVVKQIIVGEPQNTNRPDDRKGPPV